MSSRIEGCTVTGSSSGIYVGGSTDYIKFCHIRMMCDICGEQIATDYFTRDDVEFNHLFQRSIFKNFLPWKIYIIGVCKECIKSMK